MAFDKGNVGYFPGTKGKSGFLTYTTQDDNLAAVKMDDFFTGDGSQAVKDFVSSQGLKSHATRTAPVVLLRILASDGQEHCALRLTTAGILSTDRVLS